MLNLSINDDIAVIEFNDGKANVISKAMAEEIMSALDEVQEKANATIITGAGDKFSAGFDLKTVLGQGDETREMLIAGFSLLIKLYSHPMPLLAACNGHAMGMGAFILLCCDNRVGVEGDFKIGLPETAGGMPFTPLLVSILESELNPKFMNSAALQSQMCSGQIAIDAGFLDMVVGSDKLLPTAMAGAQQLSALPKKQYGDNKLLLRAKTLQAMQNQLGDLHI